MSMLDKMVCAFPSREFEQPQSRKVPRTICIGVDSGVSDTCKALGSKIVNVVGCVSRRIGMRLIASVAGLQHLRMDFLYMIPPA
jgi:hypothetical protein